jgi:peptidyl-prolyl cis-trans isomerase D
MASPFRTFRKNQKAWMVALTILTMFAFVFLGSTARMGSSGKREDPEVFTWDYGTVHQSDLQYRKQQRQLVRQFMLSAIMKANPEPMFEARVREGINQKFPISDEKIVEAMLLEKKAKQLGIVISDDMVRSTIREISQNRLSPDVLASIVSQLQSRNGEVSQNDLFDALRAELSVDYARIAFAQLLQREVRQGNQIIYVFHGDTPGDRWDYFCRLNRKVTAQILPVPVEKFVADIPEPSPQELQKFYDQWKNVEPNPDLPTPGFRQPFKANFQYLKADYEPLLAAASPKITEQEIKSYYDEHKDEFKKTKLPDLPPSSES